MTVLEVSATVAIVILFIIFTVVVSLTVAVFSWSLPLVGASLMVLHHLVELGWEEQMHGGDDHENEGDEPKAA